MKKYCLFLLLYLFFVLTLRAQNPVNVFSGIDKFICQNYQKVKTPNIAITHTVLLQKLNEIIGNDPIFKTEQVGYSFEKRSINLVRIGEGEKKILLWSQMHGDEPTATLAILDILKFIKQNQNESEIKRLLTQTELLFIPMLNPDGSEKFSRRNAQGIDINRDALRLQTPEGRILKNIRDEYNPLFAFNLHDQSPYNSVGDSDSLAAIALLAPAFNREKSDNDIRIRAKKLIVFINNLLQKYMPGKISKYDDEFEPRAFGDNVQLWGSSTILIESGGFKNDPGKEILRKMNYQILLSSFFAIADNSCDSLKIADYDSIPYNKKKFCDLLIRNGEIVTPMGSYISDLAIMLDRDLTGETVSHTEGKITEVGDLSNISGIEEFDAAGYKIFPGKFALLNDKLNKQEEIESLLNSGVTCIITNRNKSDLNYFPFKLRIVQDSLYNRLMQNFELKPFSDYDADSTGIRINSKPILKPNLMQPADLYLERDGEVVVVIGGQIKFKGVKKSKQ